MNDMGLYANYLLPRLINIAMQNRETARLRAAGSPKAQGELLEVGIGGGCHLNRCIESLIQEAGFRITELTTGYLPGPRPMTYTYEGVAQPLSRAAR